MVVPLVLLRPTALQLGEHKTKLPASFSVKGRNLKSTPEGVRSNCTSGLLKSAQDCSVNMLRDEMEKLYLPAAYVYIYIYIIAGVKL